MVEQNSQNEIGQLKYKVSLSETRGGKSQTTEKVAFCQGGRALWVITGSLLICPEEQQPQDSLITPQ